MNVYVDELCTCTQNTLFTVVGQVREQLKPQGRVVAATNQIQSLQLSTHLQ